MGMCLYLYNDEKGFWLEDEDTEKYLTNDNPVVLFVFLLLLFKNPVEIKVSFSVREKSEKRIAGRKKK